MFKIGEKVVYIDNGKPWIHPGGISPKKGEIVTIHGHSDYHEGCYYVSEYLTDENGVAQSFQSDNFRKLDHQYSENLLEEIVEKVKQGDLILN